jgi:acetolactate synthase regulatory subunit
VRRGSYAVHATLVARTRDPGRLLRVMATFHQRGIEILAVQVDPPSAGRQSFRAVFEATPGQADTLHRSVTRRVDVLTAELTTP